MIDYDNMLIEERTVSFFLLMIFLKLTRYSYKLAIFSLVSVLFLVQFEYGNLKKKQDIVTLYSFPLLLQRRRLQFMEKCFTFH